MSFSLSEGFLSTKTIPTQVLVQFLVISRLDFCAGLPLSSANDPYCSLTSPIATLHWLPVADLKLAYKAKNKHLPSSIVHQTVALLVQHLSGYS